MLAANNQSVQRGISIMLEVNVKEARSKLSILLDKVERGEQIIITRRGKKIALLVSMEREKTLPSLEQFRASISSAGKPLSETVIDNRQEERH